MHNVGKHVTNNSRDDNDIGTEHLAGISSLQRDFSAVQDVEDSQEANLQTASKLQEGRQIPLVPEG